MGIDRKERKRALSVGALTHLVETRLQDSLTDDEQDVHSAAEIGDLETVKRLMESGKVSSICTDSMGRTCLYVATVANDTEMVRYLINLYPEDLIHSAFLCAVENDREKLCDIYMAHPMYTLEEYDSKFTENSESNIDDPSEPVKELLREALIIAATHNNFLIVKKLLIRGIILDMPHEYFCMCKKCSLERSRDFMRFTNGRLDAFRAIASPAYLVSTEKDPIVASFHLSEKFRKMAEIETEYKQVYYELDSQVQTFTLDLLGECQSSEEVRILLGDDPNEENPEKLNTLPLINMGLVYKQKKFLAHHKCQSQVAQLWYSGVPMLRYLNYFNYLMLSIPVAMVFIPILSIIYLLTGNKTILSFLNTPIMRFLSYTSSYLSFLVMMVMSKLSLSENWAGISCRGLNVTMTIFIVILSMWLVGLIWEECKQIWEAGPLDYLSSLWNILDSIMLNFLFSSFLLNVVLSFKLQEIFIDGKYKSVNSSKEPAVLPACDWNLNDNDYCRQKRNYDIIVEWSPEWSPDPELISDVCFSLGIMLSVCRIAFLMPCNEIFGTMLVSFYRTLMDLFKLCGMFALVLIAFTCSIAALYSAFQCNTESFNSVSGTLVYLVWGLFGMSDSNAPDLDRNGKPMHSVINNLDAKWSTTIAVGYVLYGIFIFASTIVLINLLIAVMSNTFQEIQDEQESEWKFSRTELWLTFIDSGCCVPPPFNILPSVDQFYSLFRYLWNRCSGKCLCPKQRKSHSKETLESDEETGSISTKGNARMNIISKIIRRFVLQLSKEKLEDNEGGSDDVMKRLIDNLASKLYKKLDSIKEKVSLVEQNVTNVHSEEDKIQKAQNQQLNLVNTQIQLSEKMLSKLQHLAVETKETMENNVKSLQDAITQAELRTAQMEKERQKTLLALMEETRKTQEAEDARRVLATEKESLVGSVDEGTDDKEGAVEEGTARESAEQKGATEESVTEDDAAKQDLTGAHAPEEDDSEKEYHTHM
ncbi:short transient receptor potential channel 3-like isoform X5 [Argonauta hians]